MTLEGVILPPEHPSPELVHAFGEAIRSNCAIHTAQLEKLVSAVDDVRRDVAVLKRGEKASIMDWGSMRSRLNAHSGDLDAIKLKVGRFTGGLVVVGVIVGVVFTILIAVLSDLGERLDLRDSASADVQARVEEHLRRHPDVLLRRDLERIEGRLERLENLIRQQQ